MDKTLSNRAIFTEGDDNIFVTADVACKAKARDPHVINATIGTLYDEMSHFSTVPLFDEELKKCLTVNGRAYTFTDGGDDFIMGIKHWVFGNYYEEITNKYFTSAVAAPGGTGAIALAERCYANQDQTILIPSIGWKNYEAIAMQASCKSDYYNLFKDDKFDLEGFKEKLTEVAKKEKRLFVIINNPCHNPSGYTLSIAEIDKIVTILKSFTDIPVVLALDIAYFDYEEEEKSRNFFNRFGEIPANFLPLICFSASKTFSIYGLRVGALLAVTQSKEVIDNFRVTASSVARSIWSCPNHHALTAMTNILNNSEKRSQFKQAIDKKCDMLEARGNLFMKEANECGLKTLPYVSGFFITITVKDSDKSLKDLIKHDIYLIPVGPHNLRVAICSITLEETKGLAKKIKDIVE